MPLFAGDIGEGAFPEVPEQREGLILERHKNDIGQAVVIEVAGVHSHSRDELAVFGQRHAGVERTLLELSVAFIVKVGIVDLVVGDEDIHPAIQVKIGKAYSHAFARMGADSTLRRDIFEGSVALIEE